MKSYVLVLTFDWPDTTAYPSKATLDHHLMEDGRIVDGNLSKEAAFHFESGSSVDLQVLRRGNAGTPQEVEFFFKTKGGEVPSKVPFGAALDGNGAAEVKIPLETIPSDGTTSDSAWTARGGADVRMALGGDWAFTVTVPVVDDAGNKIDFIWDPEMIVGSDRSNSGGQDGAG